MVVVAVAVDVHATSTAIRHAKVSSLDTQKVLHLMTVRKNLSSSFTLNNLRK